jgi:D-inositol-3-phosphate glycosyltransferase
VALEALASGVPVIAADAGGVRENLRQGLTGMLVPAGDAGAFAAAIESLLTDREQLGAMREAARAFSVGRDWARELDQLESIYESLCVTSKAVVAPSSWPTTTSVR